MAVTMTASYNGSTYNALASTRTLTFTIPSGLTTGDHIIVSVLYPAANTITPQSGYTHVYTQADNHATLPGKHSVWWYKVAGTDTPGSTTHTFTSSADGLNALIYQGVKGANQTNPIGSSAYSASGSAVLDITQSLTIPLGTGGLLNFSHTYDTGGSTVPNPNTSTDWYDASDYFATQGYGIWKQQAAGIGSSQTRWLGLQTRTQYVDITDNKSISAKAKWWTNSGDEEFQAAGLISIQVPSVASSFTATAVLRKTAESSFTAAATLKRTWEYNFSATSVLVKNITGNFAASAYMQTNPWTITGSITADAELELADVHTTRSAIDLAFVQSGNKARVSRDAVEAAFVITGNKGRVTRDSAEAAFALTGSKARVTRDSIEAAFIALQTRQKTFTVEALLSDPLLRTRSFTASAILLPAADGSFFLPDNETGSVIIYCKNAPDSGISARRVYRRSSTSSGWVLVQEFSSLTFTFTDWAAPLNVPVYYKTVDVNALGWEAASVEATPVTIVYDGWLLSNIYRGSFGIDVTASTFSPQMQGEDFSPIQSKFIVPTGGILLGREGSIEFVVDRSLRIATVNTVKDYIADNETLYIKSPFGESVGVSIRNQSIKYLPLGHANITLDYVETEEA
jgi:hypothetical protein